MLIGGFVNFFIWIPPAPGAPADDDHIGKKRRITVCSGVLPHPRSAHPVLPPADTGNVPEGQGL